ncbi:MAG TPA: YIP1 family protein [Anaerolineales bacterium]|nr:YIP1 family protein [Anaerolineales bacterium]
MTNDLPSSPLPPPPMEPEASPSIFRMWVDAVTKPAQSTYAAIARSPKANVTNAFVWVFLATLVQFFISFAVNGATENRLLQQFGGQNLPTPSAGTRLIQLICGAPIGAVVAVLFFALFVGIMHLIARVFGGRATYEQLVFTISTITVPFSLIGAVLTLLAAIPFVGICFAMISILIGIYAVVLEVIALMGVEQIGVGGALVSTLVLPVLVCVCISCAVIASLMVLGPVIGNTFSSINSSLQGMP